MSNKERLNDLLDQIRGVKLTRTLLQPKVKMLASNS